MTRPRPLPADLGRRFSVRAARDAGVTPGRLRRADLEIPYRGVRAVLSPQAVAGADAFATQAMQRRIAAWRYAPRLLPGQFFSHETAVALRGGPLPLVTVGGAAVDGRSLPVHVSTMGTGPLVRAIGVRAHRADPRTSRMKRTDAIAVADPATCWAELGALPLADLIALGDYFCRVWRRGPGRKDVGRAPLATIDELRATIAAGRRVGIRNLRDAVDSIREDTWSPRESHVRVCNVRAGLPEPLLNQDVYDDHGRFLGCFDLVYPDRKVVIEYHGLMHAARYGADVERMAALRAAGWTVIEVTNELLAQPTRLIARIRAALGP